MYSQRSNNFNSNRSMLIRAAEEGDIRTAAEAITTGGVTDEEYRAALMKSSGHGHLDLTKALANHPSNTAFANVGAARMAAQYGHAEVFYFFINEKEVDLCIQDGLFVSVAAQFGKVNILQTIKSLGFDFTNCNNVAFFNACQYGHDDAAAFLVREGMPYLKNDRTRFHRPQNAHHERKESPYDHIMHMASKGNSMLNTFKALIDKDLPYEALCKSMVKAASYGQIQALKLLTDHGADINHNKVEALSESARFNQQASIDFILSMNECDRSIGLQRALKKANDYAQQNKEAGRDLVFKIINAAILHENSGTTAQSMMVRCLNGKQWEAALEIIKACPWVVDDQDIISRIVKFSKDSKLIEHVLGEAIDFSNEPWVDIAISYGNFDNARILVEQGLTLQDVNTAMVNCARFGNLDLVKVMIDNGANADFNNSEAVNLACQYNHDDVVAFFAEKGQFPNQMSLDIAKSNREDALNNNVICLKTKKHEIAR